MKQTCKWYIMFIWFIDCQPTMRWLFKIKWLYRFIFIFFFKVVKYILTLKKYFGKDKMKKMDTGPLFVTHVWLSSPIKKIWITLSEFGYWKSVGLCNQPTWAQHWLNIQVCSEKGDMWRWQMARCWQWVAGRLPVSQFTWRFIKHFGQAPLERPCCGVTWYLAWGIL